MILHITTISHRDRSALGVTDTQDKDIDALLLGSSRSLCSTRFVVFTIRDNDDGTTYIRLLGEALCSQVYRSTDVGALRLNQVWCNVLKEHLGRNVVARDRQLHKSIASEDNQTNLIIGKVIYKILYQHLALVETRWNDILCQH